MCKKVSWQRRHGKKFLVCGSCDPVEGNESPSPLADDVLADIEPGECVACGSRDTWQNLAGDWRCEACSPPPSESLVADRRSDRPTVVSVLILTACRPWCEACGCYRGVETAWSDGRCETRCWTCKREMSE